MSIEIIVGDAREQVAKLAECSIHCCVTSPPYFGLRDYGTAKWVGGDPSCDHLHARKRTTRGGPESTLSGGQDQQMHQAQYRGSCPKCGAARVDQQIGLEDTPEQYITQLVEVFRHVKRALRNDGTLWIVIGDSYASTWSCGRRNTVGAGACDYGSRQTRTGDGVKEKDLIGIPWMLAFALRADGWYLRSEIIWEKPSAMPESVVDRPTRAHEQIFLFSKSPRYYYDGEAIKEPLSEASILRLSQPNLANQAGSERAHAGAKSNGAMKAVGGSKGAFGPEQSRKRSGNKERKFRADNGGNPESTSNQGTSIPWEDDGGGRNKRTIWRVAAKPYKDAHFATYPPELIEPCILAGSPRQACEVCGAPWVRQVEKAFTGDGNPYEYDERLAAGSKMTMNGAEFASWKAANPDKHLGWKSTCSCENAGNARGRVLDPFNGAGTTGLVCSRLERDYIGIELKAAYAKMSRKRIKDDAGLFSTVTE